MEVEFFMAMNPPTATAQMRKWRVSGGRPVSYEPDKVKAAKRLLCGGLAKHRPPRPLDGAVRLSVSWRFPPGKSHRHGEWRITRPDTDNLQKLLKDCMTACGFWSDDAQVCSEHVEKLWSDEPGIYILAEELDNSKSQIAKGDPNDS